jgi:hypothetical protein
MKNLVGMTLLALVVTNGVQGAARAQAGSGAAPTTAEQIEQMERDRQQAFVQRKESHALFTRVLVKTNGRWRAVAYQQTALPDE